MSEANEEIDLNKAEAKAADAASGMYSPQWCRGYQAWRADSQPPEGSSVDFINGWKCRDEVEKK